jgi:hypothetical protein
MEKLLEAVFCAISAETIYQGAPAIGESLETAVRIVGGWCEMAASFEVTQLEK